jgi:hypothetical protein
MDDKIITDNEASEILRKWRETGMILCSGGVTYHNGYIAGIDPYEKKKELNKLLLLV